MSKATGTSAERAQTPAETTPTLAGALAALWARQLTGQDADAIPADGATPLDGLAEGLEALGGPALSPAKLALLRATLTERDIAFAARRLAPSQTAHLLGERAAQGKRTRTAEAGLTVAALDALTPDAWAEFVRWLSEQQGVALESRAFTRQGELQAWRAEGDASRIVCAWRTETTLAGHPESDAARGWPLHEADVRRMAAVAAGDAKARVTVVTPAEATVGATLAARELGIRLQDRAALADLLASMTTARQREQERSQEETKARAKAAAAARKKLLAALTAIEAETSDMSGASSAKAPSARPAVRKAAGQVEQAQRVARQALLAWETLLTEWTEGFGERPARDGSLQLQSESSAYAALAERADHLKKPLQDALRALAKTPGEGDLGYAPWRVAVGEELAARVAALRWRAQMIDPAQWSDYTQAVDDVALQEATRADNAGAHAAARAERARAQLVERVGAL